MSLAANFAAWFHRSRRPWWEAFDVFFDEEGVVIRETTRSGVTEERFSWASVRRVCFKDRGLSSDVFFVSTGERPDVFIVPVEAAGGNAFWDVLRERGLFPEKISAAAIRSTDGRYYCWPEQDTPMDSANELQPTRAAGPCGQRETAGGGPRLGAKR